MTTWSYSHDDRQYSTDWQHAIPMYRYNKSLIAGHLIDKLGFWEKIINLIYKIKT